MSKNPPLISVIVPAHNEEDYLAKCLTSLINQELKATEYEIIVVDNASVDKTANIAKSFGVRVISEPKRSVVLARQAGVNISRGKIIVSADADTIYPPFWLTKIKKTFGKNPKLIAVVGWLYFDNTSSFYNIAFALGQQVNSWISQLTGKFPLVYAANFAFKKEALDAIGGYPAHLPELGDQQYLLYRFFKLGKVIVNKQISCRTSARKHKEPTKNMLIYNGWYRIIGYAVNRIIRKELIGPAPAVRKGKN